MNEQNDFTFQMASDAEIKGFSTLGKLCNIATVLVGSRISVFVLTLSKQIHRETKGRFAGFTV